MLTLTILFAALASGLPLFSESFAQGQPGAETCAPFDNFLDSISPVTGAFGSVVFAGSAGDELVCSSTAAVDSIASSLSQRLDFAVTCGEQTWTGKTCASTTKFADGPEADHTCVLVRVCGLLFFGRFSFALFLFADRCCVLRWVQLLRSTR